MYVARRRAARCARCFEVKASLTLILPPIPMEVDVCSIPDSILAGQEDATHLAFNMAKEPSLTDDSVCLNALTSGRPGDLPVWGSTRILPQHVTRPLGNLQYDRWLLVLRA
jgi:hypothetical protein